MCRMRRPDYQVDHEMAAKTVHCALALWRRDDDRISVCTDAAPNPGPAQSRQDRPKNYKEGKGEQHIFAILSFVANSRLGYYWWDRMIL